MSDNDLGNYHRTEVIGNIDGSSVIGVYHAEEGDPFIVMLEWKGMRTEVEPKFLHLPMHGHVVGDMTLDDWARIKELAQTDVVERLIAMARQWFEAAQH